MRNAFADEITKISENDKRLVLLSGDIGNRLFDEFREKNNDRFVNCGIAEANMMSMAAGIAMCGLRPIVYTITPFTTTRCLEQIKIGACYHNNPVTIVGTGSGLSYAQLGPTHHSCEDVAILRSLPHMTIFCPADPEEMRLGLREALKSSSPTYIRLGKKGEPNLYEGENLNLRLGKSITMRTGDDVCLISSGTILSNVIKASEQLNKIGISTQVENFHTIKPLDTCKLSKLFCTFKHIGVIEEHFQIGGLFSAIAEWKANYNIEGARIKSFGIPDAFLHEVGTQDFARNKFNLSIEKIVLGMQHFLNEPL